MRQLWGLLLLLACSTEYDVRDISKLPNLTTDTSTEQQTTPPDKTDTIIPEQELYAQIQIEPFDYDFGEVEVGCSETYDLTIKSVGTAPLIIESFWYVNSLDLQMTTNHKFPLTIQPGEEVIVSFEYNEDDTYVDIGRLYIYSNARGYPEVMASHTGQGVVSGEQIDVFEQTVETKSDILFVIDNSCSMSNEQNNLATNSALFVDELLMSGVDFQIAVVTTDNPSIRGGIITNSTPDVYSELSDAIVAGTVGSAIEMGQEMAKKALEGDLRPSSGFQRTDAFLSVIIVSDEDDFSLSSDTEYYDYFFYLKDPDLFAFNSVVSTDSLCPSQVGARYMAQSALLGGVSLSACAEDWGLSATALAESSFNPNVHFTLSGDPYNDYIEVFINGIPTTEGWIYIPATNTVTFDVESAPAEGDLVQILYNYIDECIE